MREGEEDDKPPNEIRQTYLPWCETELSAGAPNPRRVRQLHLRRTLTELKRRGVISSAGMQPRKVIEKEDLFLKRIGACKNPDIIYM